MSPVSFTAGATSDGAPLLVGPRARSGMQALADRVAGAGHPARVFGHPALAPANRDVLVVAAGSLTAAAFSWLWVDVAITINMLALALAVAVWGGMSAWPRVAAWTVIAGRPSPQIRRIHVLAVDVRRPQRWRLAVAAFPIVLSTLFPGEWMGTAAGVVALAVCAYDPFRARQFTLDAAAAWANERVNEPESLVLVSSAASGYGEGVIAVVDWFGLDVGAIELHLDEEGDSGVIARLAAYGLKVAR